MITLVELLLILIIHWIADFVLQTDKQAKGKSKNWSDLINHTIAYSLVWMSVGVLVTNPFYYIFGVENWLKWIWIFSIITFICHIITDYFTSRLNTYLWNKGDDHNFFVSIGFDQLLHYIQLFLTYYYLKTIQF
jgi:hypothetical protein